MEDYDFPNEIASNTTIRQEARDQLSGEWTQPVIATLLFFVVSAVAGIMPLISLVISGALGIGYCTYYLRFIRGEYPDVSEIFSGFSQFLQSLIAFLLILIIVGIGFLFLIVPGVIAALGLGMTYFIMADNPGMNATDAMQESWDMMKGHKTQLFLLHLSFLPWAILCIFTLFIGILWLYPYMYTSLANFYMEVSGQDVDGDEIEDHLVMDM